MPIIASLLPLTLFLVLGYVVLYCSLRSEGATAVFGKILAIWVFILALAFPLAATYMSITGFSPMEEHMRSMEEYRRNLYEQESHRQE